MKFKKLITTMLLAVSCFMVSMPVSAANNDNHKDKHKENIELEKEEDYNGGYTDSIDLEIPKYYPEIPIEEVVDQEANAGISLLYTEAEKAGQWIQAADGRWWYRHTDGTYTKSDWEKINGKWYYFDASGWMKTGWILYNGNYFYCDSTGAMQTGWVQVSGSWYYLDTVYGVMQKGWVLIGGTYYYCNEETGAMVTGWIDIRGTYYYMNSSGAWVNNTGTQMIAEGIKYIGNPYKWGGNSLTNGVDCSGFTQQIHAKFGISIPRVSKDQYTSSKKISKSQLEPGDLVFTKGSNGINHVAFYMGEYNGVKLVLNAANAKKGITTNNFNSSSKCYGTYWR